MRQRHSQRRIARALLPALASLCIFLGLAGYLLFSAKGAEWMTRLALSHYLGLRHISIGRIQGNALEGFTAKEVRIPDLLRSYPGAALDIAEASLAPLFQWNALGPQFTGRGVRLHPSPLAETITAESAEGTVFGGIVFHEMHFSGLRRLPPGNMLDIQELDSAWPVNWQHLRSVNNGRLRVPESDPVVFFGRRQEGRVDARVFSKALDIQETLTVFAASRGLGQGIRGTVNDLNLTISGNPSGWDFEGTFQIAQAARQEVAIANNAGRVRLSVALSPLRVTGEVLCWGGTITAKQVLINVRPSKLLFSGDPAAYAFELNGGSVIGTTKIYLTLKGTKSSPKLMLASEPPMSQEILLLMLATGKSWRGAREAFAQGEVSSELATDFIDYAFFGGLGNRMARWFGITDLAITQNPEHNSVGAQATFADRMMLDVEVDPAQRGDAGQAAQPAGSKQSLPYRVGAEYQVTDRTSVRIEGERTPVDQKSAVPADPSAAAKTLPEIDSSVLLKVKRQF